MRRVTLVLAAVLLMSPAASADAADPARWTPTGTTSLPLDYWQGVTVDPERNLYFDGFVSGLYRTDPALQETGRADDAIPPSVRMGEGYNHIGDISWDAGAGGRLLLPLECYYPGRAQRRQHVRDRLDRRRRPAVPAVALLREARPERDPEGDVERGVAGRRAGLDLRAATTCSPTAPRTSCRRTRGPPGRRSIPCGACRGPCRRAASPARRSSAGDCSSPDRAAARSASGRSTSRRARGCSRPSARSRASRRASRPRA